MTLRFYCVAMALSQEAEAKLQRFIGESSFATSGVVVTDLDGTAVHEFQGKITIPKEVELGLMRHYEHGRPLILNSLRFPLSVIRTFGQDWYKLSNAPIPTITLNGSLMGLVMSVPFMVLKNNSSKKTFVQKYGPVYGLAFGFGLWLAVFMPITLMMVAPFLNSFENQDVMVRQVVPSGEVASVTFFGLLSMMDRIIYGAIAFNMFYGLLTAILLQSFSEKYLAAGKRRERQAGLVGRGG